MEYILIKGKVRNLAVSDGFEDLSPFKNTQETSVAVGILETAVDSSVSSTIMVNARNSAVTRMKYFTCHVGDYYLKGRFYRIGFEDDEEMEFVVKKIEGMYEVFAACSLSQKLIWTLPNQTRGHSAQKRNDLKVNVITAIVVGVLFSILASGQISGEYFRSWSTQFFVLGFVMIFILGTAVRRRFYEASFEATKIFEVFGFSNPEEVNLPKNSKRAEKKFALGKAQPCERRAPWEFRYDASEIP